VGLVTMRIRGTTQRGGTVMEFHRSLMAYRRGAPEVTGGFPDQLDPSGK
jgi:hypothetical protein